MGAEAPILLLYLNVWISCLCSRFSSACGGVESDHSQNSRHRYHPPFGKRRDIGNLVQITRTDQMYPTTLGFLSVKFII